MTRASVKKLHHVRYGSLDLDALPVANGLIAPPNYCTCQFNRHPVRMLNVDRCHPRGLANRNAAADPRRVQEVSSILVGQTDRVLTPFTPEPHSSLTLTASPPTLQNAQPGPRNFNPSMTPTTHFRTPPVVATMIRRAVTNPSPARPRLQIRTKRYRTPLLGASPGHHSALAPRTTPRKNALATNSSATFSRRCYTRRVWLMGNVSLRASSGV